MKISHRIFGTLPAAAEAMFNTDNYVDRLHSPTSAERGRRGCGARFVVDGVNIRYNLRNGNDENKKSFINIIYTTRALEFSFYDCDCSEADHLHRSWSSVPWWSDIGGISTRDLFEPCLYEDYMRIIINVKYIQTTMSHIKTIRFGAKDSDIFSILLYFAKSLTVDILFLECL